MIMCNDIENNLDETVIPSFTEDDIVNIDRHYNEQVHQVRDANIQDGHSSDSESENIEQLYETLDYNELINEHMLNIERLYLKLHDYNSIEIIPNNTPSTMEQITEYTHLKRSKRLFYFHEIEPIISNDRENLREVISILSDNIQTISS
jgi:hypothetical protein